MTAAVIAFGMCALLVLWACYLMRLATAKGPNWFKYLHWKYSEVPGNDYDERGNWVGK